jgi:hypothetical protein
MTWRDAVPALLSKDILLCIFELCSFTTQVVRDRQADKQTVNKVLDLSCSVRKTHGAFMNVDT